jgi:hypothetical protein
MTVADQHIVLCSGVKLKPAQKRHIPSSHLLELQLDENTKGQNIKIGLPYFIQQVNCHFPDRIKDLLEIAGYIYAADRLIKRGNPGQLEYHNWSRNFHFHLKVRDYKFWNKKEVKLKLNDLLTFMSGDRCYSFTFHPGAQDVGQTSMFDMEGIEFDQKETSSVAMFSGGLDSLAGALEKLETTDETLFIISHRSNNPAVSKIQNEVYKMIKRDYDKRIKLFPFECNLTGDRAAEETQRTRVFLYTSIALSLAYHTNRGEINVFENGVTSINLSKRQDLINARASRTTHPKTLYLIQDFFRMVTEKNITINHPYIFKTKKDIFDLIAKFNREGYINSTMSCTKTFNKFKNNSQATHCGVCSQCIDRRISAFAAGLEDYDAIYNVDIAKDDIPDEEGRSHLNSYLRFNMELNQSTDLGFYAENLDAMSELVPYLPGKTNSQKAESMYRLLKSNAENALVALRKIRSRENILQPKTNNSLFSIIDNRHYLMTDPERMAEKISEKLNDVIPISFRSAKPTHENSLNDMINAHLINESVSYEREFPTVRFSFGTVIPDHSFEDVGLFIEAKYIKKTTQKSRITDEIAADIIKYPADKMKLFIVYDPEGKISDKKSFQKSFLQHPLVRIQIIK